MKAESGRSLIEVIGVLAVTGLMTVGAMGAYKIVHSGQERKIAEATMEQIARDTKTLMEMRGDYTGISVDYLIKAGALDSDAAPLGGADWNVVASADGKSFSINLVDLSEGECDYFETSVPKWANAVLINGYELDGNDYCFSSATNQISFIVE